MQMRSCFFQCPIRLRRRRLTVPDDLKLVASQHGHEWFRMSFDLDGHFWATWHTAHGGLYGRTDGEL